MRRGAVRAAVVAAGLAPLGMLLWDGVGWWSGAGGHGLGANPIEEITHRTGDWALRLLVATLAVTPLRRLTGWNGLIAYRRTLGLLAFLYAALHFATFVVLDHFFDWQRIVADVGKRRFVTAGFAAFVLLVPLAVTSTRGWVRRLGRRWAQLHRLVYAAAVLAVVHYYWLVKSDARRPLAHGAVVAVLLLARLVRVRRGRQGP